MQLHLAMTLTNEGLSKLCILTAMIAFSFILLSLTTGNWEYHTYDERCVLAKNSSTSLITKHLDHFSIILYESTNPEVNADYSVHYIHDQYAGMWQICNKLSGKLFL